MEHILVALGLLALCLAAIILAAIRYRDRLARILNAAELALVGKIVFVVLGIMLLVALRNAIELPAGQFIYGRF